MLRSAHGASLVLHHLEARSYSLPQMFAREHSRAHQSTSLDDRAKALEVLQQCEQQPFLHRADRDPILPGDSDVLQAFPSADDMPFARTQDSRPTKIAA